MANHDSAIREHRKSLKRRVRNRAHRGRLRTAIKQLRKAVAGADLQQAQSLLPGALSLLDRTAKHGSIHHRAAARTKSRLTLAVARLSSGPARA